MAGPGAQHGWAYGADGTALRGKTLMSAITSGRAEGSYGDAGCNRFTIRDLLAPFEQTARLCGMRYLPPFVVHGTHVIEDADDRSASRGAIGG